MPRKLENVAMDLPKFTEVLDETEQIIQKCFKQFRIDEVFLSFNGGKDCTVLLDVTIRLLRDMSRDEDLSKNLKVLYIRTVDPFNEIEEFVKEIEMHYGLKLIVVEGEMKETLQRITEDDKKLKACLMGTRRTDPYSEDLKFMQNTDAGWPQILRVSPLLNWSYHQIWSYILQKRVPYCSLYDQGYTSIGSTYNTRPNDALAYIEDGCIRYNPAWLLPEGSLERAGRGKVLNGTGLKEKNPKVDLSNGTNGPDITNDVKCKKVKSMTSNEGVVYDRNAFKSNDTTDIQ